MNKNINPIDDLVDQLDMNETVKTCDRCLHHSKYLFNLSCCHVVCMECIEKLVKEDCTDNCPLCQQTLLKKLSTIASNFFSNPLSRLEYYYGMNVGDILWAYSGNNHNWLYTKEQCEKINSAFDRFLESSESDSFIELKAKVGDVDEIYIIDFDSLIQYPKKNPQAKRKILAFELNSLTDLKKNKIIGVAGKYL